MRSASKLIKENLGYEVQLFGDRLNTIVENPEKEFEIIKNLLEQNNLQIQDHRINIPSLENVFIHLVQNQN